MRFGKFLKEEREKSGLTIQQLADECGVSVIYIADVESGESNTFAEGLFYNMARILDVDGDEFIVASGRIPKWAYKRILKNWPRIKAFLKH